MMTESKLLPLSGETMKRRHMPYPPPPTPPLNCYWWDTTPYYQGAASQTALANQHATSANYKLKSARSLSPSAHG
ncbi:hypothetical protein LSTR_LSTR016845, partial [Laodelphax striatellus]